MTPSRSTFAGLERLGPGDPLSSDGYAFTGQNIDILDILTKLGAVTHEHDAHAAMVDPTTDPTVTTASTGGSIPSSTAVHVVYTLTDENGGESLPSPAIVVTTAAGYATPDAPPAFSIDYTTGSLLAATLLYAITVTDGAGGETALGPAASVTIKPGHANGQVTLSGLTALTNGSSGSSSSAMWRMWRSVDGGSTWDLMGTGMRSTDTFVDDGSSGGDCTVSPPPFGTTAGTSTITVTVPSSGQPGEATFFSIYADTTGQFISPCLLVTLAVADYDAAQTFTALAVQNGQPPAVSQCYPGANQIDPSTDILDWAPRTVTTIAFASTITPALPAGDAVYNIGALTGSITIADPSGTPVDGQTIRFRLSQDGTGGRTITWGSAFAFGTDVTAALIPSAASSAWEMMFGWCAPDSTWRALAITRGF